MAVRRRPRALNKTMQVNLSEDAYEELKKYAEKATLAVSTVGRLAVLKYIEREPNVDATKARALLRDAVLVARAEWMEGVNASDERPYVKTRAKRLMREFLEILWDRVNEKTGGSEPLLTEVETDA